jgi:hypothetical protein
MTSGTTSSIDRECSVRPRSAAPENSEYCTSSFCNTTTCLAAIGFWRRGLLQQDKEQDKEQHKDDRLLVAAG